MPLIANGLLLTYETVGRVLMKALYCDESKAL